MIGAVARVVVMVLTLHPVATAGLRVHYTVAHLPLLSAGTQQFCRRRVWDERRQDGVKGRLLLDGRGRGGRVCSCYSEAQEQWRMVKRKEETGLVGRGREMRVGGDVSCLPCRLSSSQFNPGVIGQLIRPRHFEFEFGDLQQAADEG